MPDINMQVFEEVQRNQLVTEVDIQTQAALDDYQVQLSDIANPTQSQDNVVIDRFGEFLPHWNESLDFDIWVKMSMEIAGKQLLMLRGNSSVNSASSGVGVFLNYYSFENTADGWSADTSTTTVSSHGDYSMLPTVAVVTRTPADVYTLPYIWEIDYYLPAATTAPWAVVKYSHDATHNIYLLLGTPSTTKWGVYDGTWTAKGIDVTTNTWHKLKIIINADNSFTAYSDDIFLFTGNSNYVDFNQIRMSNGEGDYVYYDAERVRKYTAAEPTVTVGASKNIVMALKTLGRAG